jgi:PAS domain S-box-containing protein
LTALILLVSVAIGMCWIGRFTDPIVALTAAVSRIGLDHMRDSGPDAAAKLEPIQVGAPDEIGDLAAAFNSMLAELQRSFDMLARRVADRTAELRQQTRYLRTLMDTLPMWVCLKDTHGRYLAANESLAKRFGLQRAEDVAGRSDVELWPAEFAALILSEDQEVLRTKQRKITETQMRRPSEEAYRWVERFRAPVFDDDGTALGVVVVSRDITPQKEADAAREQALSEAVQLARMRSDFLARMSHELRTPLNAILGYAQILRQQSHLTEAQARGIAVIFSSGEHLLALINDILDLARIDAAKLELTPVVTPLSELVESVTEIIRIKAQEKGLAFEYQTVGEPGIVLVDAKRLSQVLLNLLSNAVKFTDVGSVTLRMLRLDPRADSSGAVRVRFEVEDSGIGMNEQQIARLFRPFEQLAEAHRREGGSGLGLAISQQLLQLMGGRIVVRSQVGKGSLFTFELDLPVVSEQLTEAAPEAQIVGYEGRRRSILVVDDVETSRAMLMDLLMPLGFEVFAAASGRQALVEAERLKPDLILMDVMMPDMDGLDAARRLRLLPALSAIPIIAVSAGGNEDLADACEAGADAALSKPLQRKPLLEVIGEQLRLSWVLQYGSSTALEEQPLVPPPAPEIDALHRLALEGDLSGIGRRADHLMKLDVRYTAFATQLKKMAIAYQSKAVLAFVDRYRD